jgi:alpha-amylase
MLIDLSLARHGFDLTDTLMRRKEGYHQKLAKAQSEGTGSGTASIHDLVITKERGLEKLLVEDWYLKRCFIDHFLAENSTVEDLRLARIDERGDFVLGSYQYETDQRGQVRLFRNGQVRSVDGSHAIRIAKSFHFDPSTERIDITYELNTTDHSELSSCFAIENNFSFQAGHAHDRYLLIDGQRPSESFLDSVGSHAQARGVGMVDEWRGLAVAVWSQIPCNIWHHPIYTVSLSESGFEKVYQGTTLVHVYHVKLSSQPVTLRLTLHAGTIETVLRATNALVSVSTA